MSATATAVAPVTATPPQIENLVQKYITLRDKKSVMKKAFDASVESIDAMLAKLESHFLTVMKAQGLTSLPTAAGTPYQSNKTSVTVADPAAYFAWVLESPERSAFLDIKANKTAVVAYKEEHADLPPGLNWREELGVNVRR